MSWLKFGLDSNTQFTFVLHICFEMPSLIFIPKSAKTFCILISNVLIRLWAHFPDLNCLYYLQMMK